MRVYDLIRAITYTDNPEAEVVVQVTDGKGNNIGGERAIESAESYGYKTVVLYVEQPDT